MENDKNCKVENYELSLVDLWIVLSRHKAMIVAVFVLTTIIGVVASYAIKEKYKYTTTLEIGSIVRETGGKVEVSLIEDPETVKGKLESSYIPLAQEFVNQKIVKGNFKNYEVSVEIPKKSQIVVLVSDGPKSDLNIHKNLHKKAIDYILDDHKQIIEVPRNSYKVQLGIEKLKLEELKNPKVFAVKKLELDSRIQKEKMTAKALEDKAQLIDSRFVQLGEKTKLLTKQIAEVTRDLNSSRDSRNSAVSEVTGEAKAMTLLMINNQIEQNRTRLATLEERLFVQLPDEKKSLENQKRDNSRLQGLQEDRIKELHSQLEKLYIDHTQEQQLQEREIDRVQNKLDNLRPTRLLGLGMMSQRPIGYGRPVIWAASAFLGIVLGVFMAVLAEFFRKVRQQNSLGDN